MTNEAIATVAITSVLVLAAFVACVYFLLYAVYAKVMGARGESVFYGVISAAVAFVGTGMVVAAHLPG